MKRALEESNSPMEVQLVERTLNPYNMTLVNPAKVAKRSPEVMSDLEAAKGSAELLLVSTAKNKLQLIAKQMKFLEEETRLVLDKCSRDHDLHHVACNFVKVPGHFYHLYKKESGQLYFGMLAPTEWVAPHEFQGSYRLESDLSWTKLEEVQDVEMEWSEISDLIIKDRNRRRGITNAPIED